VDNRVFEIRHATHPPQARLPETVWLTGSLGAANAADGMRADERTDVATADRYDPLNNAAQR
jgi:hypothetical protein